MGQVIKTLSSSFFFTILVTRINLTSPKTSISIESVSLFSYCLLYTIRMMSSSEPSSSANRTISDSNLQSWFVFYLRSQLRQILFSPIDRASSSVICQNHNYLLFSCIMKSIPPSQLLWYQFVMYQLNWPRKPSTLDTTKHEIDWYK